MLLLASALVGGNTGVGASSDGRPARSGAVSGAAQSESVAIGRGTGSAPGSWIRYRPGLPSPAANNAVAAVSVGGDCWLMSALGIGPALDHAALTTSVYLHRVGGSSWADIGPPPSAVARVAASAVGVAGKLYLLGGYSVAADGAEASFDNVDVYDPVGAAWSTAARLLVPIDDAVVVAWRDRYIVVISGWSHTDNVDAVQMYDTTRDAWSMATPFPGTAVFGHAGAIDGDEIVVIDGVERGPSGFRLVKQSWRATLDVANPMQIGWTDLGGHPGQARYRAAGGTTDSGELWFHGGTEIPYNTDGLAYAGGAPAPPSGSTLVYAEGFVDHAVSKPMATMDHRSLAKCGATLYLVGGMTAGPAVTADVWSITP